MNKTGLKKVFIKDPFDNQGITMGNFCIPLISFLAIEKELVPKSYFVYENELFGGDWQKKAKSKNEHY